MYKLVILATVNEAVTGKYDYPVQLSLLAAHITAD